MLARYKAEGYDYLLLAQSIYDLYLPFSTYPEIDRAFPAALDAAMIPVWTDGLRYTLYGWKGMLAVARSETKREWDTRRAPSDQRQSV